MDSGLLVPGKRLGKWMTGGGMLFYWKEGVQL